MLFLLQFQKFYICIWLIIIIITVIHRLRGVFASMQFLTVTVTATVTVTVTGSVTVTVTGSVR